MLTYKSNFLRVSYYTVKVNIILMGVYKFLYWLYIIIECQNDDVKKGAVSLCIDCLCCVKNPSRAVCVTVLRSKTH